MVFGEFQGFLALILVLPVIFLLCRWKWRLAVEREKEVMRLANIAAEEELRAEMEAAREYEAWYWQARPVRPAVVNEEAVRPTERVAEAKENVAEMEAAKDYEAWSRQARPVRPAVVHEEAVTLKERVVEAKEEVPKPSVMMKECALCFRQAASKCSRCKAVWYCSGKCQIIHWRLRHKVECYPPSSGDNSSGQSTIPSLQGKPVKQSISPVGDFKLEGQTPQLVQTFPENSTASVSTPITNVHNEDSNLEEKTKNNLRTRASSSTVDSFEVKSSGFSSTAAPKAAPFAADSIMHDSSPNHVSSSKISPSNRVTNVDVTDSFTTRAMDHEKTSTYSTMNNILNSSYLNKEVSMSKDGANKGLVNMHDSKLIGKDAGTTSPSGKAQIAVGVTPASGLISKNLSNQSVLAEGISQSRHEETQASSIDKSDSAFNSTNYLDSRKSQQKVSSVGDMSTFSRHDTTTVPSSIQIDNASTSSKKAMTDKGPAPNGMTSHVKRAVEHVIAPKIPRNYPSDLMLFPYDVFIKLYNYDKAELRPAGLINFGNSCYANAVLQCLTFTRPLTAYLLEGFHSNKCQKREWCFTCEFENLLANVKQGKSPLAPTGILSHLNDIGGTFGSGNQEDAHEFLRYAIEAMQSVCLKEAGVKPGGQLAEETTLIQQTFGGYLQSKIKCSRCKGKSEQCERMMDLTVEIHGNVNTLEEALHRFTSSEILDGENKYKCDRCKSYERARKKLSILEAPNVLTIALKRFQSGTFAKLNKTVRFQEYLDLAPYMSSTDDKSPIYRLYAVIIHIDVSNSSSYGHYICYVKDTRGRWYNIDDSKVRPVELEKVLLEDAYMLLYARCLPHAPSSIRKAMANEAVTIKRPKDKDIWGKPGSVFRHPSVSHRRSPFYPSQVLNDHVASRSLGLFEESSHPFVGDYSSDSTSLFSHSDEGSLSTTDSTMGSTITEDFWENLSTSSPLRDDNFTSAPSASSHSGDTVSKLSSDLLSQRGVVSNASSSGREDDTVVEKLGHVDILDRGDCYPSACNDSKSLLYLKNTKQCRNLTEQGSIVETNWNSDVLFRTSNRAQTFY